MANAGNASSTSSSSSWDWELGPKTWGFGLVLDWAFDVVTSLSRGDLYLDQLANDVATWRQQRIVKTATQTFGDICKWLQTVTGGLWAFQGAAGGSDR